MGYAEKIKDPRWQKKRLEVFDRDNWKCIICQDDKSTLVVHHLCYIPNTEPWDHPATFLQTLCEDCHKQVSTFGLDSKYRALFRACLKHQKKVLEDQIRFDGPFYSLLSHDLDCIIFLLEGPLHDKPLT